MIDLGRNMTLKEGIRLAKKMEKLEMMRPHCDVCGKLIEVFPSWVELRKSDNKLTIFHPRINEHQGHHFCLDCVKEILEKYLAILK